MGKFSDLLFGGKKSRPPADPTLAIPVVVPIVVHRPDGGASASASVVPSGAKDTEPSGLETSASMGSLHELAGDSGPSTPKAGGSNGTPSAWQRIRHNNSLGGIGNPLNLIRSKSKSQLSKIAVTNAASGVRAEDGSAAVERSTTSSPSPSAKAAAAQASTPAPPSQSYPSVVITNVGSPTAASSDNKSTASTPTTPVGGKSKSTKANLNVTPLQLPAGDRGQQKLEITGAGGEKIGIASSPKSPPDQAAAQASDADSQHADILRRRRVELFAVLLGSHDILPEFKAKYELISDLGVGAFGFVISAREKASGKEVAVKFISKESVPRTSLLYDDRLGMIPSEIFVLRRLKHPHILGYIESFADAKYYYMVTELHGDIWGPKGIEKDPVYTYRPLNATGLTSSGSPGSSLNSRDGVITTSLSVEKLPGSPRDSKRKGTKTEKLDSPRDSSSSISSIGTSSTSTASPPATKSKKSGKTKRTGGNGTVPANQIMQLLKTKIENVDGRRHTISLPTHPVSESVPVRVRKLSDPLWGRFHLSTTRRAYSRDLFDCIDLHRRLSESTARKIFSQLLSAVAYLQSQNLAHGDIKDENILVDRNFDVRLIDFGATSFLHQRGTQETFIGTMHYASPEILLGGEFDHAAAEVWTLGILLYTMMVGTSPFNSATDAVNGRFRLPRYLSSEAGSIIRTCLQPNPADRASVSSLLKHPWLRQQS